MFDNCYYAINLKIFVFSIDYDGTFEISFWHSERDLHFTKYSNKKLCKQINQQQFKIFNILLFTQCWFFQCTINLYPFLSVPTTNTWCHWKTFWLKENILDYCIFIFWSTFHFIYHYFYLMQPVCLCI